MSETGTEAPSPLALVPPTGEPCSFVILGGAGDLSRRKLLAGLYNLALDKMLPSHFCVIGFARTDLDDEKYRALARESVSKYSRRPIREPEWSDFERRLHWVKGPFDEPASFERLAQRLDDLDARFEIGGNRIFYLSIAPSWIETCLLHLRASSLIEKGASQPFHRMIVEKPIGQDLASARAINDTLASVCDEHQIFRIDHYLGKETVQNIMVMRFANAIFEPLWNQKYVDHVQITVAEQEGVGTRGGYYEEAGALRDMVQNHILQLLCLTAMEPPYSMSGEVVRDHKQEVLRSLRPIVPSNVKSCVVRAQYAFGEQNGEQMPGYRREDKVSPDSRTETFVAIKCFIDNWRWADVPFYLRTGKHLPRRASEIAIQFKQVPHLMFDSHSNPLGDHNVLALHLQPDEGLSLGIAAKHPGTRVKIDRVKLEFHYREAFDEQTPEAYERLMLDVMTGDSTLFMRRDAVEASWEWVDHIQDAWEHSGERWLPEYAAGTWGPVEARHLIELDGRRWREP